MMGQNESSAGASKSDLVALAESERLRKICDRVFANQWSTWGDIKSILPIFMEPAAHQSARRLIHKSIQKGRYHPRLAPNARRRIHDRYLMQIQLRSNIGPKNLTSVGLLTGGVTSERALSFERIKAGKAFLVQGLTAGQTVVVIADLGLGKTTTLSGYLMLPYMDEYKLKVVSGISCENNNDFEPYYVCKSLQSDKVDSLCAINIEQIEKGELPIFKGRTYLQPSMIVTDEGYFMAQRQRAVSLTMLRLTAFWTITRHLAAINVWSFPREDMVPSQIQVNCKRLFTKESKRTMKCEIRFADGSYEYTLLKDLKGAPDWRESGERYMIVPEEGAADTSTWDIDTFAMMHRVNLLKRRIDEGKEKLETTDQKIDRRLLFYKSIRSYIDGLKKRGTADERLTKAQFMKSIGLLKVFFDDAAAQVPEGSDPLKVKANLNCFHSVIPEEMGIPKAGLYDIGNAVEKAYRKGHIKFTDEVDANEIDAIAAELSSQTLVKLLRADDKRLGAQEAVL